MKNELMAMSLEELLIVLAIVGILTLIVLDSWRMVNEVRRHVSTDVERSYTLFDSLYRKRTFIQDDLEKVRIDSMVLAQKQHEKTVE